MSFGREKSIVRFQTEVSYIEGTIPSQPTRSSTKLLGTRTSSLSLHNSRPSRLTHQYIPRLHRQTTEIPKSTPLGSALEQFGENCLLHEFCLSDKSVAIEEMKTIMNKTVQALYRNLLGLQFLPAMYAMGFSHWDKQPERRIVCYLPIRLPNVEIQPETNDTVLLRMPRSFPSSMNIEPSSLGSSLSGFTKFVSFKKFYSLVMQILRRILKMKSVHSENLNFSSSHPIMEIILQENVGWVAEIIPCVVSGTSDSIIYCCKPLNRSVLLPRGPEDGKNLQNANTPLDQPSGDAGVNMDDSSPKLSSTSINSIQSESVCCVSTSRDFVVSPDIRTETRASQDKNHRVSNNITHAALAMENLYDIQWYPCNPRSENSVFKTISKTDGGVRMTAMMIVCKLVQHDWRLLPLRCYDVQTALLHDVEHRLDHSPRWQRDTLEHCVRSVLSKLHNFAARSDKCLPHFSVMGVNLWSHLNQKQLALAESALRRLVLSDTSLASLVCRTGGISFDHL